jgi:prolyl-tRNA synthetase
MAESVYERLTGAGVDVCYDDRDIGAGEKFADAELLGCPLRLTVGRRSLENGEIEAQIRRGRESQAGVKVADLLARVDELCRGLA